MCLGVRVEHTAIRCCWEEVKGLRRACSCRTSGNSIQKMRRQVLYVALLLWFVPVQCASVAAVDLPPPKKYKNCTELRRVYPKGVARDAKSAVTSGATVDVKTYRLNMGSDRDKDGVACE